MQLSTRGIEHGPDEGWGNLPKKPEAALAATMSPDVGWGRLAKQPEQLSTARIIVGACDYLDQLPDSASSDGSVRTFHSDGDGEDLLRLSLDDIPPSAGLLISRTCNVAVPFPSRAAPFGVLF